MAGYDGWRRARINEDFDRLVGLESLDAMGEHDPADIGEIQINQARDGDQVGNALYCLA